MVGGGWFRELEYCYSCIAWAIIWDPNKVIDIGEWWMCGQGRLERFYCVYIHVTYSQPLYDPSPSVINHSGLHLSLLCRSCHCQQLRRRHRTPTPTGQTPHWDNMAILTDGMAEWVERPSPALVDHEITTCAFKPWPSQNHDLKIYIHHLVARCSAWLG